MKDIIVNSRLTIPGSELVVSFARSSGPGGQNVNKVNTKATIRWQIRGQPLLNPGWRQRFIARHANRVNTKGQVVLSSDRHRNQPRNLAACTRKLVQLLQECQYPKPPRKKTSPTLGSKRRRLAAKQQQSEKKRLRRPPLD